MSLSKKLTTYRDCAEFLSRAGKGRVRVRFETKSKATRFRQRCYKYRHMTGKDQDVIIELRGGTEFWCLVAGLPEPPALDLHIEQLDRPEPAEPATEPGPPPTKSIDRTMTEEWIAGGCKGPGPGTPEWNAEFIRRAEQAFDPMQKVQQFGLEFDIADEDIS